MYPKLYLIAGPNGAGKTTASLRILPQILDCEEFVNADEIARGLSPFHPEEVAFAAGRLQLERIKELIGRRVSFSIETTLATKSYKSLIDEAHRVGYTVELLFFCLSSADKAVERVKHRVLSGGHNIPEDVIRRRFVAGLRNLVDIYMSVVDSWRIVDNNVLPGVLIAKGSKQGLEIYREKTFKQIMTYGRKV